MTSAEANSRRRMATGSVSWKLVPCDAFRSATEASWVIGLLSLRPFLGLSLGLVVAVPGEFLGLGCEGVVLRVLGLSDETLLLRLVGGLLSHGLGVTRTLGRSLLGLRLGSLLGLHVLHFP